MWHILKTPFPAFSSNDNWFSFFFLLCGEKITQDWSALIFWEFLINSYLCFTPFPPNIILLLYYVVWMTKSQTSFKNVRFTWQKWDLNIMSKHVNRENCISRRAYQTMDLFSEGIWSSMWETFPGASLLVFARTMTENGDSHDIILMQAISATSYFSVLMACSICRRYDEFSFRNIPY